MKVSDFIAKFLEETGVGHIFTVSGAGNLHILDSIHRNTKLSIICNHHEQASAMAMEAYSRMTENLGVSIVTFGPGSTNALTGVAGAWCDSIPCVVISGQTKLRDTIKKSGLRQRGIQEIDIVSIVKPVTKYAVMVRSRKSIKFHLQKAVFLARAGRPGPVWLDIPMDLQGQEIDESELRNFEYPSENKTISELGNLDVLTEVARKLRNSSRPIVLLGHGIRLSKAIAEMNQFVEEMNIPILTSWNGADLIASDHPLLIGRPGIYGQRGANFALQNCDFLLSIGARLSIPQVGYQIEEFCREATVAVVDIDVKELNKYGNHFDFVIAMDAKSFFEEFASIAIRKSLRFCYCNGRKVFF